MNSKVEQSFARIAEMSGGPLAEYKHAILDEICNLTDSTLAYVAAMNLEEDMMTMVGWSKSAMAQCAIMDQPIVYKLEETGIWGRCSTGKTASHLQRLPKFE